MSNRYRHRGKSRGKEVFLFAVQSQLEDAWPSAMPRNPERPCILVVLIHGTWGRGLFRASEVREEGNSYWFQNQSYFFKKLSCELSAAIPNADFIIEPFLWSGANSVKERFRASADLALWLIEKNASGQFSDIVIIAHSHGGNIIKNAALKLDCPNVHLITMATPFLEIILFDNIDARVSVYTASFFVLPLMIYAAVQLVRLSLPVFKFLDLDNFAPLVQFFNPYCMYILHTLLSAAQNQWFGDVFVFIMLLIAISPFVLILNFVGVYDSSKLAHLAHCTKGNLSWAELGEKGVLIIRSPEDEAGLVLAAAELGNLISDFMMSITSFVMGKIFLGFGMLFLAFIALVIYPIDITKYFIILFNEEGELNKTNILVSLAFFYLVTFVLSGIFKSTHGGELFIGTIGGTLNAQSVPDLHQSATVVTLPIRSTKRNRFRHSVYEHDDCVVTIVKWLQRRILVAQTFR